MPTTIYTVQLPGGLHLRVEMKNRPVDFEIVFPGDKKVTFHWDNIAGTHLITADGSLTKTPGTARKDSDGNPATPHTVTGPGGHAIAYSDPGMD